MSRLINKELITKNSLTAIAVPASRNFCFYDRSKTFVARIWKKCIVIRACKWLTESDTNESIVLSEETVVFVFFQIRKLTACQTS